MISQLGNRTGGLDVTRKQKAGILVPPRIRPHQPLSICRFDGCISRHQWPDGCLVVGHNLCTHIITLLCRACTETEAEASSSKKNNEGLKLPWKKVRIKQYPLLLWHIKIYLHSIFYLPINAICRLELAWWLQLWHWIWLSHSQQSPYPPSSSFFWMWVSRHAHFM